MLFNGANAFKTEDWFSDSKGRGLTKASHRTFIFDSKQAPHAATASLTSWLRLLSREQEIIILLTKGHACALDFSSRTTGQFYDPNSPFGVMHFDTLPALAAGVLAVINYTESPGVAACSYLLEPQSRKSIAGVSNVVTVADSATWDLCMSATTAFGGFPEQTWRYIKRRFRVDHLAAKSRPADNLKLYHTHRINALFAKEDLKPIAMLLAGAPGARGYSSIGFFRVKARWLHRKDSADKAAKAFERYFELNHTLNHP